MGEQAPADGRLETYRDRIAVTYPDLTVTELRLVESGQNNDVVVADGRLIFRFPRHVSGIDTIEREVALLRALVGRLPLAIPMPVYSAFQPREAGAAFMGYRSLSGVEMRRDTLGDVERRRATARRLAIFLRALHETPVGVLPTAVTGGAWRAGWEGMYHRLRHHLFPLMRPEARRDVSERFERFLADAGLRAVSPVLVHGDFGSGNILVDPSSGEVRGVIDWGSAHLDDPAVDVAAASTIADGLVEELITWYPEVAEMLPRARFYRGTFALQEALFGAETGDAAALQAGLAEYI